ncbi:uncharacterized protein LOC130689526 [Daphnia carinata]|uniref:uncharacterized protein LOC130689526 n=1 Tax=Daphnia carinata TaxID=120202 RepID=UPI00257ED810|nr:uncharacterized protein LOC130689526 [Daphnia carinata]
MYVLSSYDYRQSNKPFSHSPSKMKFVLLFVMYVLSVSTHQYLHHTPAGLVWLSPYMSKQEPVLHNYQQMFYKPVDSDIPYFRYSNPLHPPVIYQQQKDEQFEYADVDHDDMNEVFADSQSRSKGSQLAEKLNPRFFFGTATTIRNPFIKTATFTLFTTISLSSVVSCIVAGDFVDAAAQAKRCRRKRYLLDQWDKTNEQHFISPSEPQKFTATAVPYPSELMRDQRQLPIFQGTSLWNNDIIQSTKDEDDVGYLTPTEKRKEQRFIFENSHYVASTTVTSYNFVSTTVTKTVDVAIDVGLNCVPTGYVVC